MPAVTCTHRCSCRAPIQYALTLFTDTDNSRLGMVCLQYHTYQVSENSTVPVACKCQCCSCGITTGPTQPYNPAIPQPHAHKPVLQPHSPNTNM
jgi:hypothetical protein